MSEITNIKKNSYMDGLQKPDKGKRQHSAANKEPNEAPIADEVKLSTPLDSARTPKSELQKIDDWVAMLKNSDQENLDQVAKRLGSGSNYYDRPEVMEALLDEIPKDLFKDFLEE